MSIQNDSFEICDSFLQRKGLAKDSYKIIFAMIAGSQCYNFALENSDNDYFCVYQVNTKLLLSMQELRPPQIVTRDEKTDVDHPDITCYEIGKFVEALQSGSPVIMQSLFCRDELTYQTDEWKRIKQHAHLMLTAQTVRAYIGYARSEVKQMMGKGKYDYNKFAYHAYRLVFETERIASGSCPIIWFETGSEEHTRIMDIRTNTLGVQARNEMLRELQERLNKLDKMDHSQVLKFDKMKPLDARQGGDTVDTSSNPFYILNDWLVSLRFDSIQLPQ